MKNFIPCFFLAFALLANDLAKTNVVKVVPAIQLNRWESDYLANYHANKATVDRIAAERKAAAVKFLGNTAAKRQHEQTVIAGLMNQAAVYRKRMAELEQIDPTLKTLPARVANLQSKRVEIEVDTKAEAEAKAKRQAEADEAVRKFRAEQAAK
jgi:hypothetical protein